MSSVSWESNWIRSGVPGNASVSPGPPHCPERAPLCRGAPDKQQAIDCIALGSVGGVEDTATAVLALARRSGAIELLSPLTGASLGTIPPAGPAAGSGSSKGQEEAARVRGLHLVWGSSDAEDGDSGSLPAVLSVTQGGTARLHAPAAGEQPGGSGAAPAVWEQQRSWQVPPQVCCTAYDPASGRLAVGCEGAELRLFDAASGELAFAFKGGKPNKGELLLVWGWCTARIVCRVA